MKWPSGSDLKRDHVGILLDVKPDDGRGANVTSC